MGMGARLVELQEIADSENREVTEQDLMLLVKKMFENKEILKEVKNEQQVFRATRT